MILAALAAIVAVQTAPPRELTRADLRQIEDINRTVNTERYDAGVRDCNSFAVNKLFDLITAGFQPGELRLAKVLDEHARGHVVVEVVDLEDGRPVTIVLDNRFAWTETRRTLEAYGYVWLTEWPQ